MIKLRPSHQVFYQIASFLLLSVLSLGLSANVTTIPQQALLDKIASDTPLLILDVRTPEEYVEGHVPNAINIPHDEIKQQVSLIAQAESEGKEIVVYCRSGRRAGYVESVLHSSGIRSLHHLEGDMNAWTKSNHPTER